MKRFFLRKYMGDDKYSWAVFDRNTGRPVVTGCCRAEASSHALDLNMYYTAPTAGPNNPKDRLEAMEAKKNGN